MTKSDGPWVPYEPTKDDPWDLQKVAHLHRRAGFGATMAELQRDLGAGPAASVARFLQPREETAEEREVTASLRDGVPSSRGSELERLRAYWLYRIVFHPDALREKMTLFWHNHFATSNNKVRSALLMLRQNECIRRHALGKFAALLADMAADSAMLVWLDGGVSRKERPNENFAREFLELFTLGVGHYTEQDVKEAARAFTGWAAVQELIDATPRFRFDPARHDHGEKTFLNHSGQWGADDIIRITLQQPACAEFICRKLYRFLVTDGEAPLAGLLEPLAAEFRDHGYSVRHVVGVILRSRHFYSEAALRRTVKSPVEFSAGLLRMLEAPPTSVSLVALARTCAEQAQDLFHPPSVKGWDGGCAWITSAALLARSNWLADVVWGNDELGEGPFDPAAWAKRNGIKPANAPRALVELLLGGVLAPAARTELLRAAEDGRSNGLARSLQLLLHCPEFQLA
jgi:uncharacterized protein (DUF1800 family)